MSIEESKAEQLLQDHGIRFSTHFIGYGAHFDDDKESRDCFRVTFSKGRRRLVIKFGQSLNRSDGAGGTPPHPYNILAGLTKHDPGSFDDFCDEFGYDQDSRRALRTYRLVCDEWKRVSAFFTADELEKAREIV